MRDIYRYLYYYIRYWLIKYEKDIRYSKYESNVKQTSIHIQVILNIRQT